MAEDILKAKGVEVFRVEAKDGHLDLMQVLKALAERGITRLMVEGGPRVAAAFIAADLVDEVALLRSPKVIGADGIDALEGLPLTALTQASAFKAVASEALGGDTLETFERA
jgi:diaminohydroxyphosphoribosylaminopyrimidine deaminase/5-amino-6-(5-phosphoribosylamino)uracil reductase